MKTFRSLFFFFLFVFCTCAGSFAQPIQQRSPKNNGEIQTENPALTRELVAMVNASRPAPDPVMQRWVVSQPGVKIAVKMDGMYRVSRAELQSAGFPVDSDSTNWRLFLNGNEQEIIVGDQYIDFYGRGIDTFETDIRIYYLINDTVAGKRMISKYLGTLGGNVVSNNYRFITEKKQRINYNSHIQNGYVENYWGNAVISNPPLTETFTLTSLDPSVLDATVTVKLQPITNVAHAVRVVINGHELGNMTGNGSASFSGDFVVPPAYLQEGNNSITLNTINSNDANYFDSVRVRYSRTYTADQNKVRFFTPGYRKVDVTGFTSPNIRVFDTTFDGNPQEVIGLPIIQEGSTYTVKLPASRPAVFYAVEDSGLLHSPSVTFDNPSALATPNNSADMIIISYGSPDFMAAAETWANYRRSPTGGGITVKVVDVADVFDEFSYGLHTGQAIKDFLAYAHGNWQSPAPAYVLLMGDASYDRRNYEGFGYWDLVPTKNVSFIFEEGASDDALVDFNNDGVAEMAIGRIPARSAASILTVLSKTMAFETPANLTLNRGALFAFDSPIGFDFEAISHAFRNQLPRGMPSLFIGRDAPMAHQHLIDGINAGKYIVNYSGHGSANVWGSPSFFGIADVPALTNADNPSIFIMLADYNGLFMRPDADSLSEALLKAPNGGAVVTWSGTTETTPDYQLTIGVEFYHLLGVGNVQRMGDIIKGAQLSIAGGSVGYSWNLLGDPALKVR